MNPQERRDRIKAIFASHDHENEIAGVDEETLYTVGMVFKTQRALTERASVNAFDLAMKLYSMNFLSKQVMYEKVEGLLKESPDDRMLLLYFKALLDGGSISDVVKTHMMENFNDILVVRKDYPAPV